MTTERTVNGVNVERLAESIEALRDRPDLGEFHFRVKGRWIDGAYNQTSIKGFYGVGQEDTSRERPFVLEADEPKVLLGGDQAPNPVEHLLHALTSCLTTSIIYHAAKHGIEVEELEASVEGDLDIRGFLGVSPGAPKGYQSIRVTFTVKSDASQEELESFARFSPVYEVVSRSVPVSLRFEKRERLAA